MGQYESPTSMSSATPYKKMRETKKTKRNKLKILIVDDTQTIRLHTKMIIDGFGHEIEEAVDGIDALKKIENNPPHMVLLDIMMPNMDGIECCRRIKSNPALKTTKVIMITTKAEIKKVNAAFKAGCDDYITKPISPEELLTKIDDLSAFIRCMELLKD